TLCLLFQTFVSQGVRVIEESSDGTRRETLNGFGLPNYLEDDDAPRYITDDAEQFQSQTQTSSSPDGSFQSQQQYSGNRLPRQPPEWDSQFPSQGEPSSDNHPVSAGLASASRKRKSSGAENVEDPAGTRANEDRQQHHHKRLSGITHKIRNVADRIF